MDTSRLRSWGSLRPDARSGHAGSGARSAASTTHLRHGRPHRIRGWALVRWAGARLPQRRYLRLVHYVLTVFDGADEHVDLELLEQVLVGSKVHWNARKHEIVICTPEKDKIVVTVRTAKEFDAWKVGFADAAREPAQYYTLVQSRKLGAGAFSEVFFGFDRDNGDHAAIKVVDKTQCTRGELEHAQTEARVMAFVQHPAVIACRDIFDGPDSLHVVMEFMPGGTLEDRVRSLLRDGGPLPEHIAATVLANVLSALVYLEAEGICHRDIKPDNILIGAPPVTASSNDDWAKMVRLSDFGLAAFVDSRGGRLLTDFVGTPHYVAPEVLARSADNSRVGYGCTVDVWAVGVIAYWMLSGGQLPFDGDDSSAVCRAIRDGRLSLESPPWEHVSPHAKSFVRSLLQPVPRVRLTAAAALTHPWMLRSRGERTAAVSAATATAFAISRAAGPVRNTQTDIFNRRRLSPRALLRVLCATVFAANRLSHAVLSVPLVPERALPPDADLPSLSVPNTQSLPELTTSRSQRRQHDLSSFASLKRPHSKKQSSDRMLPAPERAPIGTDGLGYNVGLFRSFAPKQRTSAGSPDPSTSSTAEFGSLGASIGSLSFTYGRRSAGTTIQHGEVRSASGESSNSAERTVAVPIDSDAESSSRNGSLPSTPPPVPNGGSTAAQHRLRPLAQRAKSLNSRAAHRRRTREEANAAAAAR